MLLAMLALAIAGLMAYRRAAEFEQTNRIVNHTHEVLFAVSKFRNLGRDAQSSMRGYLLSNEESFLDPLFQARQESDQALSNLKNLVADNPAQSGRVAALQALFQSRTGFENELLKVFRTEGFDAARRLFATGRGKALFEETTRVASEMEDEERRLLEERSNLSHVSGDALVQMFAVLGAMAGLAFFTALYLIGRDNALRLEAETALRASEHRLHEFIRNTPWIVGLKDAEGKYLLVNTPYARVFGRSPSDIIGRRDRDFLPLEHVERYEDADRQVIDKGTAVQGEEVAPAPDGSLRHYFFTKFPIGTGLEGKPDLCVMAIDITDRKDMEAKIAASTKEIEDLYNKAPCGYHSLDRDGYYVLVNDVELGWIGCTREQAIGRKRFRDFLAPESRQLFEENFPKFMESGSADGLEFEIRRHDGNPVWVSVSATAVREADGTYRMCRSVLYDITARKQAEGRIMELARQLEEKNSHLETANKELEAFSYSVSHDLRAPLRSVDGFSQALEEEYRDRFDDAGRDYLNRIRSAIGRMSQLIDDLLELAKVSRIELSIQPVNFSQLVQDVCEGFAQTFPGRNVELVIQSGLEAHGDPRLLRIVLENLIGNAWKFTSKRAAARIEIGREYLPHGTPYFFVKDNGAGFDMAYASKLFGIFQRLHGASEFEGTGIGLVIVQRIVHRHGGMVWADGAVNHGAKISFMLPGPAQTSGQGQQAV